MRHFKISAEVRPERKPTSTDLMGWGPKFSQRKDVGVGKII